MKDNVEVLDFSSIWVMLFKLAKKIQQNFQPEVIIGITRGGFVITRILSDILAVKKVGTIGIRYYKGINETAEEPELTHELCIDIKNQKTLLVDDVADSGHSLKLALDYLKRQSPLSIKTATLHYKPQSIVEPDYFLIKTTNWLVYPWEWMEFTRNYFQERFAAGQTKEEIQEELKSFNIPAIIIKEIKSSLSNNNNEK
jgi:hypothetical protein